MTPTQLRDRFRREVDDELQDAADDSAALFKDDEILDFLNDALQKFVHDTRYINKQIEIAVTADTASVDVPDTVIELRENTAYLKTYKVYIEEKSYAALQNAGSDDYGRTVVPGYNPLNNTETGRPRFFSFDVEANKIHFFPVPDADDTIVLQVYVEAEQLADFADTLPITNGRHQRMLLNGMKHFAYGKLDAETYNPEQQNLFEARFERDIRDVRGERQRRRRDPGPIQYGGIPHG